MLRPVNDGFKKQMEREVIQGFLNMCLTKNNMTAGATSCVQFSASMNSLIIYTIGGVVYSTAGTTSGFAIGSSGMSTVGSGQARRYAVCITSNASIVLWGGDLVSAGSASATAFCNAAPASQCILGTILISLASTSTWAAGSALASGAPWEWTDCFMVPQGVIINT